MSTKAGLIGRAKELASVVAQQAPIAERERAVSAALMADFCDAGFMKMMVPKRYGGFILPAFALHFVNPLATSREHAPPSAP